MFELSQTFPSLRANRLFFEPTAAARFAGSPTHSTSAHSLEGKHHHSLAHPKLVCLSCMPSDEICHLFRSARLVGRLAGWLANFHLLTPNSIITSRDKQQQADDRLLECPTTMPGANFARIFSPPPLAGQMNNFISNYTTIPVYRHSSWHPARARACLPALAIARLANRKAQSPPSLRPPICLRARARSQAEL